MKTTTLSTSDCSRQFMLDKNKLVTDVNNGVSSSKIDNININLSSNTKKINSKVGFFIIKARLVFI